MARTFIIFILMLLLPIFSQPAPAGAWDLIRARIISINPGADGSVSLTVIPESESESDAEALEIEVDGRELPADLKAGDSIRIWEKSDGEGGRVIHISPSRGFDATGVRSRLGGRGRGGSGRGSGGRGGGGGGGR